MNKESDLMEKCLDEMYRASTPSITWDEIKKKYWNTNIQFFLLHKIKEKDYIRIKEKYKKKLDRYLWNSMDMGLLAYSPTCEDVYERKSEKDKKRTCSGKD